MSTPALQAFLEKEFGGRFDYKVSNPTVGTTESQIVNHNFERMGLAFIQLGSGSLYLLPSSGVSSTNGIALSASGGSASFAARDDLVLPGLDWFAIGSAAGQNVLVIELFRYGIINTGG